MVCASSMQSMLKLGGSGGMPPGIFLKIDTKRLNLVAFQSIKITIFLGKLKISCMDNIWNISIGTVNIPSAHVCV